MEPQKNTDFTKDALDATNSIFSTITQVANSRNPMAALLGYTILLVMIVIFVVLIGGGIFLYNFNEQQQQYLIYLNKQDLNIEKIDERIKDLQSDIKFITRKILLRQEEHENEEIDFKSLKKRNK